MLFALDNDKKKAGYSMSPLLWLQRLFVPRDEAEKQDGENVGGVPDIEESPFVFNQHMRIVLAIVVSFISAIVIWWILV